MFLVCRWWHIKLTIPFGPTILRSLSRTVNLQRQTSLPLRSRLLSCQLSPQRKRRQRVWSMTPHLALRCWLLIPSLQMILWLRSRIWISWKLRPMQSFLVAAMTFDIWTLHGWFFTGVMFFILIINCCCTDRVLFRTNQQLWWPSGNCGRNGLFCRCRT